MPKDSRWENSLFQTYKNKKFTGWIDIAHTFAIDLFGLGAYRIFIYLFIFISDSEKKLHYGVSV